MSRRMSVSFTLPAVRARTKTVTRRHHQTWDHLLAGDELELIEKGMGLPKGAKQVVVARVRVLNVEIEPLAGVYRLGEVEAEGFPEMTPPEFAAFWLKGHGYGRIPAASVSRVAGFVPCRRIEWEYL